MDAQLEFLNTLGEQSRAGVMVLDQDGGLVMWSDQAQRVTGRLSSHNKGSRCWEALRGATLEGYQKCSPDCGVIKAIRAGITPTEYTLLVEGRDKRRRLLVVIPLVSSMHGQPHAILLLRELALTSELQIEIRRALNKMSLGSSDKDIEVNQLLAVLTKREFQVLNRVAAGLRPKHIAKELGISESTTRNHIHSALQKMGCHSIVEALALLKAAGRPS